MGNFDTIQTFWYRGSLDSCNYSCSYCAFGRKKTTANIEQDQKSLLRFCEYIEGRKDSVPVNIMLIPYGEALIHSYYRENMVRLAALPHVTGIGCQTNLSFAPSLFLQTLHENNISPSKIKLWATFHPEMVTPEPFVRKIAQLKQAGIEICVGVVGDPGQINTIRTLRELLPPEVYLFVNAMEGFRRALTEEEKTAFREIDNLFDMDYQNEPAQWAQCAGGKEALFVNPKGDCYPCPRSRVKTGNIYTGNREEIPSCNRKRCDCYIAYCHLYKAGIRRYMQQNFMWRIPARPPLKAAFFDIDGTLTDNKGNIPERYQKAIRTLAEQIPLFLATALPVQYAKKRLGTLFTLFSGGVFAGGGHILYRGENHYIPVSVLPVIPGNAIRVSTYQAQKKIYKYAITTPSAKDALQLKKQFEETGNYNLFTKGKLLTLTDIKANKKNGLLHLCRKAGINPAEALGMGDTANDSEMITATGYPCAVLNATEDIKAKATYILNPDQILMMFKTKDP
ncbi:MAG: STM4011 family radical SAM protein [Tannerellaceae bacterium]|nr:STM4011 family radical SAM protein [Tannerellaceae bacterium]